MSFCRFGLLRSRSRLLGGLKRAGVNGVPLFDQALCSTDVKFSGIRNFGDFAPKGVSVAIGGLVGVGAIGYVGFNYYIRWKECDESGWYRKFVNGHQIPPKHVPYEIERPRIYDAIKYDMSRKARLPQVVNIVADKNIGKSVEICKAAQLLEQSSHGRKKVWYIDASQTLKHYLKTYYQMDLKSEKDALDAWMGIVNRYAVSHPSAHLLVILDSPDSWEQAFDEATMDQLMRFMKDGVASYAITFYCISSDTSNIFTKERISVFGSRFKEIKQKDWGIDFTLNVDEKEQLIKKYEANEPKLTKEKKERLKLNETNVIGDFVRELTE